MVASVPYDTIFNRPVKNKLSVKLTANTFAPEAISVDDSSSRIISLFEVFGSAELASIARHDTVGGIGLSYELTSEVDDITKDILAKFLKVGIPMPAGTTTLDISKYVSPVDLTDSSLPGIFIDEHGDLVINLIKLEGDEGVEVEALSGGIMVKVTYGLEEE